MKVLKFGFLFVFFGFTPSISAEEDWTRMSSVKVIQSIEGRNGIGAGTIIGVDENGYDVLTCCHVILVWGRAPSTINGLTWEDAPVGTTWVEPYDGKRYAAEVMAYHKNCDLALLRVKDKLAKVTFSPIATKETYDGTEVTKCGYPGNGIRHIQRSRCMGRRRGRWSFGNIEWDTAVSSVSSRSGDSGGGLFRESDHQLVGVVWGAAKLDGGEWRLCAVPVDEIQTFLKGSNWKRPSKIKMELKEQKKLESKNIEIKKESLYTPVKEK